MMEDERFIILDIDGVLSTDNEFMTNRKKFQQKFPEAKDLLIPYPFNKKCVEILNDILSETKAKIVISSDWRIHWSLDELNKIFKFNGIDCVIIGITPIVTTFLSLSQLEKLRSIEITEWLVMNNPKHFVIIDDLNLKPFLDERVSNFVLIRDNMGLKQTGVKEKITKILLS